MKLTSVLITGGIAAVVIAGLVHSGGVETPGLDPLGRGLLAQPATVTVTSLRIDGAPDPHLSVVGNGGRLVLKAGYSVRTSSSKPLIEARLQQRRGRQDWKDTGVLAAASAGGPIRVTTPAQTTTEQTETIQYRLVTETSESEAVSVTYENQQLYTGIAAEVFGYAAAFCPSTAVHVDSLPEGRGGDFQSGSLLIRVSDRVGHTTNLQTASRRSLALHECAHERQWLDWGGDSEGGAAVRSASAALFQEGLERGDPIEHAADCAAKAFAPDGYLGYGGYCSSDQVESGRRLLLGQRY